MRFFLIPLSVFLLVNCTKHSLAEEQAAIPMPYIKVDSAKIGKVKKVVILGNSITHCPPNPSVGWFGDWGASASCMDSDYVHRLIRNIHNKDTGVIILFENISYFEWGFFSYDFSALKDYKDPDLLIVRISENVDDDAAAQDNFLLYYDKLVNYIDSGNNAVKVIVDGFWQKKVVNNLIKEYASQKDYPFISITDLGVDNSNTAYGIFSNSGVASHPSDKGMRLIAQRMWAYIKSYFP